LVAAACAGERTWNPGTGDLAKSAPSGRPGIERRTR
jgi:hypothetical protein